MNATLSLQAGDLPVVIDGEVVIKQLVRGLASQGLTMKAIDGQLKIVPASVLGTFRAPLISSGPDPVDLP